MIFSLLFLQSHCASFAEGNENTIFKSFDIRTENTRPKVSKLYLDRQGQIWTGTDHGLFAFDGTDFLKISGTDSVFFKKITSIYESNDGTLWAGCASGNILKVKRKNAAIYFPQEDLPKVSITGFTEDKNNKLFFCTNGNGVYYIEHDHLFHIGENEGLSDNYCYQLITLDDGRIAVATDAGINFIRVENGKIDLTTINSENEIPDDIIRSICPAEKDRLWIGMQDKGVLLYDYKHNKIVKNLSKEWSYGPVTSLEMTEGELIIATENKGVFILENDSNLVPLVINLGRNYKPTSIIKDLENNIWIAESIHLIRTAGNKLKMLDEGVKGKISFVHSILSAQDQSLYFSVDHDLYRGQKTKDGKWNYTAHHVPGNKSDIVTLYEDPSGYLWLGTMGSGVYRFNPRTAQFRSILSSNNIESASILSIKGTGKEIWIAGFNGAKKYTIENIESDRISLSPDIEMNSIARLNDDYVYTVFIDSKNRCWFATDQNGAYFIENKKLKNLAIPGNAIHSFTEDKSGRIWIGSAESGVVIYSEDTIIRLEPKDGLSSPSISSLHCASTGKIIMVHSNGIDLIDPVDFSIIHHSTEEGLSDLNASINSIAESKQGTVFIGTEKGILKFRPSLENKLKHPKIVLNSVSVFLENIDLSQNRKFDFDENNFRFDYTGLWYTDPKRVNYFYLLDGHSTRWQQTKDRYVIFPKLNPGKYTFHVKASLNNTFTDLKEASYSFEISPPFWQTWWFRISASAALAILLFLIILERDSRIRRRDRELKDRIEFQFETLKSQVNPHFLFNSFNTLISVIEKQPKMAVEYVEKLSEFFRSIVNYRDKNLIPLNEELDLLENYIFIQKKRYGENLIVQNRVNEDAAKKNSIPPLVLQLLAENAIKHNAVSRETPLLLRLEIRDDKLCITNNLNPKISPEKSTGLGLQNIISRYKLLTEENVIIEKKSSEFSVKLPLIFKSNA